MAGPVYALLTREDNSHDDTLIFYETPTLGAFPSHHHMVFVLRPLNPLCIPYLTLKCDQGYGSVPESAPPRPPPLHITTYDDSHINQQWTCESQYNNDLLITKLSIEAIFYLTPTLVDVVANGITYATK